LYRIGVEEHPLLRQMAAISSMGKTTPVSLFAHMMETMAVSGRTD